MAAAADSSYILVKSIVRPNKVDDVKDALVRLYADGRFGSLGMTVTEVRGHGKQKGHTAIYRGEEYNVSLLPKMRIEVVAPRHAGESLEKTIIDAARTGEIGDGRVFVHPVYDFRSIHTGELLSADSTLPDSQHRIYTAVVRPSKVDDVKDKLKPLYEEKKLENIGMTVTEVRGHGKEKGHNVIYLAQEHNVFFFPKMKIDVVVPGSIGNEVSNAMVQAARTGKIGDGRVWWMPVEDSFRIRTGERQL